MRGVQDELELEIRRLAAAGYQVTNRTATAAQLVRRKRFNFVAACLWFLVFGFGVFIYIAYYLSKSDEMIYLALDPDGSLAVQGSGSNRSVRCPSCGHENSTSRINCKRCHASLFSATA
jgi:hypothetical protein